MNTTDGIAFDIDGCGEHCADWDGDAWYCLTVITYSDDDCTLVSSSSRGPEHIATLAEHYALMLGICVARAKILSTGVAYLTEQDCIDSGCT